jgi:hypothetical protein
MACCRFVKSFDTQRKMGGSEEPPKGMAKHIKLES